MEDPLPAAIFRPSDEVYEKIASYRVVPPEKLYEYWHVYTTTFRRLRDATASRLEAFWWRVIGSDRRFLNGQALAKMYQEIATGNRFTPLGDPSNHWHISVQEHAGYDTDTQPETSQEPINGTSKPAREKHTTKDSLASSSSRPAARQSILKTQRSATSGLKKRTRFFLPHESAKKIDGPSGRTGEKMARPPGRNPSVSSSASGHPGHALKRRPISKSSAHTGTSAKAIGNSRMKDRPKEHQHTDRGSASRVKEKTLQAIAHRQQDETSSARELAKQQQRVPAKDLRAGDTDRERNTAKPVTPRPKLEVATKMITPKSTPVANMAAEFPVQVQFDSESVTTQCSGDIDRRPDLPDSITIARRPSTASLYTPTQPNPAPAPFLGRSKSQLALLLEKMGHEKQTSS